MFLFYLISDLQVNNPKLPKDVFPVHLLLAFVPALGHLVQRCN